MYLSSPLFDIADAVGQPIAGAKARFYLSGTTNNATTYSDAALTTPNTNPVIADSAGRFPPIYLNPDVTYRIQVLDASNVLIVDRDPIYTAGDGTASDSWTVLTDIPALRLRTTAATEPELIQLSYNWTEGDGGGVFYYDASDTTTADNGGTVIVDASGKRWKRQFTNQVYATWFGVRADDSTDNTTALQAAFDAAANKTLVLPAGTFRSGRINGTAPIVVIGAGISKTVWKRKANSNDFGMTWASIANVVLKSFSYNANIAQNSGSGSHGGANFTTCENPNLEDVEFIDCRGTFLGAAVGAGAGFSGSTGAVLTRVYATGCHDGILFFNQHNYFRTQGCRVVSNVRNGLLIDNCKDWVDNETFAVLNGTDVTLDASCANILVQNCDGWVSNNAYCESSAYGYGFQVQIGCDNWQINNARVQNNAWDGIGITDGSGGGSPVAVRRGRIVGGMGVANRLTQVAVNDASSDIAVVGFVDDGGSYAGIQVFRSTAQLVGCRGNVTIWDAAVISAVSIGAAGTGYTNGTYTNVPLVGPTWYTDGLGRSAATVDVTVSGGAVTAVSLNFQGWLALPPASLTGLTAPSLPGGSGAQFTITLVGASSNTCQGTTITAGHLNATLNVQAGAITTLPVFNAGFSTTTDPGGAVVLPANLARAQTFTAQQSLTSGAVIQSATAANIAAIGNTLNTTNKVAGKIVYDTTNNRMMIASGTTAASAWYVADGSASVTPS